MKSVFEKQPLPWTHDGSTSAMEGVDYPIVCDANGKALFEYCDDATQLILEMKDELLLLRRVASILASQYEMKVRASQTRMWPQHPNPKMAALDIAERVIQGDWQGAGDLLDKAEEEWEKGR